MLAEELDHSRLLTMKSTNWLFNRTFTGEKFQLALEFPSLGYSLHSG